MNVEETTRPIAAVETGGVAVGEATTTLPIVEAGSTGTDVFAGSGLPEHDREPASRGAIAAAVVATFVLVVALAMVLMRGDDGDEPAETTSPAPSTIALAVPVDQPATTPPIGVITPVEPVEPVSPVPPAITVPSPDATVPPAVPPAAPPAVAPPAEPPPPPPPPPPAAELSVQAGYELDPGVDALSIALWNQGELVLNYDIVNDGDGFTADHPTGAIDPGDSVDVWVDLDVVADGEGPTPFERIVDIRSDGGDAFVAISGQVEKPGFVVAEFDTLPLVDYRATVRFTNVGGLPVEIVGLDAPGLRYAPVPDSIAAGETYELEIAICEGGGKLPIFTPHAQPLPALPTFTIGSTVVLETLADPDGEPATAETTVLGDVDVFEPLDCSPVVDLPALDLTFDLG